MLNDILLLAIVTNAIFGLLYVYVPTLAKLQNKFWDSGSARTIGGIAFVLLTTIFLPMYLWVFVFHKEHFINALVLSLDDV